MSQTTTWDVYVQTGEEICQWIIDQGGWDSLESADIFLLVDVYLEFKTLPFIPTVSQIFGCVDYKLGLLESGNTLTGCEFT